MKMKIYNIKEKDNYNDKYKLIAFIYNRRKPIRVIVMALFILSIVYLAGNLRIDTNFEQFLDDRNLINILKQDELFILWQNGDTKQSDDLFTLKSVIENNLRESEYVYSVNFDREYDIDVIESFFLDHFYLFMDESDSRKLLEDLSSEPSIAERIDEFYSGYGSFGTLLLFPDDILGIYNDITESIDLEIFFSNSTDSLMIGDNMGLTVVRTTFPPQDIKKNRFFLDFLDSLINENASELGIGIHKRNFSSMEIQRDENSYLLAGGHIFSYYDSDIIRRDIIISLTFTALFLILLFYISFRGFSPLFTLLCLLTLGILLTYSLALILYGSINIFVASFSAVLLALGIDYLIHLYSVSLMHTVSKADTDTDPARSLSATYRKAFAGILFGAMTTALCFFTLYIIPFSLIRQLSVIIGMGILIMLIIITCLFPVFPHKKGNFKGTLFAGRLYSFIHLHKTAIFLLLSIVLLSKITFIAVNADSLRFDASFQNLRPKFDIPSGNLAYVNSHFDIGRSTLFFIAESKRDLVSHIKANIDYLSRHRESFSYKFFNIENIFKKEKEYKIVLGNLNNIDFHYIREIILENLSQYGFDEEYIDYYLSRIEQSIKGSDIRSYNDLLKYSGFMKIFERLVHLEEGNIDTVLIPVSFDNPVNMTDFTNFTEKESKEDIKFIDITLIIKHLEDLVKGSFPFAVISAVIATILIVFVKFRNIFALFSLVPTSFSMITVLFTMILLGIDFNYSSIIVLPVIFGIGIDDGIHFMHRYAGSRNLNKVFTDIFFPVNMTSFTTAIGFGSLVFSSYTGLYQIGLLSVIGILSALFYSIVFLPVIMDIIYPDRSLHKEKEV